MKYGIYKNEWSSVYVDPFTTITCDLLRITDGVFFFYEHDNGKLMAAYPSSHFYIVVLED